MTPQKGTRRRTAGPLHRATEYSRRSTDHQSTTPRAGPCPRSASAIPQPPRNHGSRTGTKYHPTLPAAPSAPAPDRSTNQTRPQTVHPQETPAAPPSGPAPCPHQPPRTRLPYHGPLFRHRSSHVSDTLSRHPLQWRRRQTLSSCPSTRPRRTALRPNHLDHPVTPAAATTAPPTYELGPKTIASITILARRCHGLCSTRPAARARPGRPDDLAACAIACKDRRGWRPRPWISGRHIRPGAGRARRRARPAPGPADRVLAHGFRRGRRQDPAGMRLSRHARNEMRLYRIGADDIHATDAGTRHAGT
jgi:hypothetical protein